MKELREIRVTFGREVAEISVTYAPGADDGVATPGTKTRTSSARRMAVAGLRHALEALRDYCRAGRDEAMRIRKGAA